MKKYKRNRLDRLKKERRKERNQHLLSIHYELGPKHVGTQMLFHLIHITSSYLPLLPKKKKKRELEEMTYTDPSSSNTL